MSTRSLIPAAPVAAKARTVTRVSGALLQRKCACGGSTEMEGDCEECKKKKLQRKAAGNGPAIAPPIVHEVLRSPGQPLDTATRSFFEPRFGHDFSKVRVHADSRAGESAHAVQAQAYTVGHDLVFGAGHFSPQTKSGQRLLAHELTHVVQQSQSATSGVQRKLEVGLADDALEREAERFAAEIADASPVNGSPPVPPSSKGSKQRLQRVVDTSATETSASAAKTVPPNTGLIVEDEATAVGPGQMRKTEFLDRLHDSVCATADSELAAVGRSAQGCPFIERWIKKLRGRTSEYIERGIRKYAPDATHASSAHEYFSAVASQVRQGVRRWAKTGEISGIPPDLMSDLGGDGVERALGAAAASVAGAANAAISSVKGAIGSAASSVGKLFTKDKKGGVRDAYSAAGPIQLGAGKTLDGGLRARMETAFGHDFSRVRVHADSRADELASSLNARAFAFGKDVAFAAGEYRPGTLVGDALIAHELAHVVQQSHGSPVSTGNSQSDYNSLEEDADISAVGAVVSLFRGAAGAAREIGKNAMPRLRSGLQLQRCSKSVPEPEAKDKSPDKPAETAGKDAGAPPAHCCCCVKDVAMKNITKTHSGFKYGHQYDLVINMEYKATTKASSVPCTLSWLEKTNRGYYPGMVDNAWNDMTALIPNSPTFAPWKNRTQPCPGSETVTITDPPQADLRLPKRTLEIKVTAGSATDCGCDNASKTASAVQVLEPDAAGGIKTQDFTPS